MELHVEQGGVLEHRDVPLGVVTGVVGQYRFAVDVMGRPNHAGTTPMNMRKDALFAAAQMVVAINKIAVDTPGSGCNSGVYECLSQRDQHHSWQSGFSD